MDPITQNPAPIMPPKKSAGPIIGIIAIVILLLIGAIYVWSGKTADTSSSDMSATGAEAANQRMMAPESVQTAPVSQSDDVDSIDQDLKADAGTDVDLSGANDIQ